MNLTSERNMSLDAIVYHSEENKSVTQAIQYSKTHDSSHRFLAYKNIPALLNKYSYGKKALDYGTGTGYSAQFLLEIGFDVTGVDVSKEMLLQAQVNYPHLPFHQIQNKEIPITSDTFDVVFSSFVLFEMGSEDEIVSYLKEAKRVMKENGVLVAVTGSENFHSPSKNWLSFRTDFPQNLNPKSGSLVKLYHRESDMEFTDYYWTEADYRNFFTKAGFHLEEVIYPLGEKDEPYVWCDEYTCSPFIIFVAKK
ncbi:MAG: class I SAM-dependent methyltransferase [Chlamydiae bacterium]|nr:class I SAM-dependent methyltransferase [Chlamydiota bacterium]